MGLANQVLQHKLKYNGAHEAVNEMRLYRLNSKIKRNSFGIKTPTITYLFIVLLTEIPSAESFLTQSTIYGKVTYTKEYMACYTDLLCKMTFVKY